MTSKSWTALQHLLVNLLGPTVYNEAIDNGYVLNELFREVNPARFDLMQAGLYALVDDDREAFSTCQHQDHEGHLICAGCGECREDLDEDDYCPDCSPIDTCYCGEAFDTSTEDGTLEREAHIQGCSLSNVEGN